jgi:RNA polymerase sigma-70 factor (ECF subfamily)
VDETKLVRQMLRGDEDAFSTFFASYAPRLYRFALTRVADEDATEEIVQATLVQAIRKLHLFRGEAALFTWMVTLCRHEIGAWLTRAGRRPTVPLEEDVPEVRKKLEALAMRAAGPEEELGRLEVARLVRVALDFLPPHYGDVLEWKYIEEVSVAEIAGRLGLTSKAAESMLARARNAFRDGFEALMLRHRETLSSTRSE